MIILVTQTNNLKIKMQIYWHCAAQRKYIYK